MCVLFREKKERIARDINVFHVKFSQNCGQIGALLLSRLQLEKT